MKKKIKVTNESKNNIIRANRIFRAKSETGPIIVTEYQYAAIKAAVGLKVTIISEKEDEEAKKQTVETAEKEKQEQELTKSTPESSAEEKESDEPEEEKASKEDIEEEAGIESVIAADIPDDATLNNLSLEKLKELSREKGVSYYWQKNKDTLIEDLQQLREGD